MWITSINLVIIINNYFQNLIDYKIFLTTDRNYVELEAIKEFGNEYVITNEGPNNHLDLVNNLQSKND